MKEIKIAAAYIRVSTEDQTEYSPAAQLRELQDFAAANGMILSSNHVYADEGISGRKAEKRPGFMKMIADAKSKPRPFDVILVHKFDRFARSREDSIVYKSMLKKVGVEVISIKEPLTEGSYSGVMEAIYESFAEAYSINLGQEVKKGMTEKARRGELQATPSFGYRVENHKLVPNPPEDELVREIFARYNSGDSLGSIARDFNNRGIRTHRGGVFENRSMQYILRNPVYIGKLRWTPTGRTRRNFKNPDSIISDASHPRLVDDAVWEAAQKRLDADSLRYRWHGRPNYDRKHWLSGIVRCAACGTTLVFSKPNFMKCNNYVRGSCDHSQHIRADLLADAVIARLQNDLSGSIPLNFNHLRNLTANADSQVYSQKIAHIKRKKERLTEAYLAGAMDLDDYKRLKDSIEKELIDLESSAPIMDPVNTNDITLVLKQQISEALQIITSPAATIAEKYAAANSIIDHCTFDKSTLTLSLTYRLSL